MNLGQLTAQFRIDADDTVAPYKWSDPLVAALLSEAEEEATIRGRLLLEDTDAAMCQIAVSAGDATYTLHAKVYEIEHLRLVPTGETRSKPIELVTREWLDEQHSDWRERSDTPRYAIQDDTRLRLAFTPDVGGVLHLEAYRLPINPLVATVDAPEINGAHHRHLIHWALHRAFSQPDSELIDPTRAAAAERAFTRYFGPRPDVDLRRSTRHDTPHNNKAW